MSVHKLSRDQAQLLVIDVQERLCAAMPAEPLARMVNRTLALIEGARVLGLPITVTEQYPKGLGPTLAALRSALPDLRAIEKIDFSACLPATLDRLAGRPQVIIAGMEGHVCVYQTVRDLAARGFLPVVCADAVLSRNETDLQVGLSLCREAGAMIATAEHALFDMLGRAGTPEFKAISAAVK